MYFLIHADSALVGTGSVLKSRTLLILEISEQPIWGKRRSSSKDKALYWDLEEKMLPWELEIILLHGILFLFFLLSHWTSTREEGNFVSWKLEIRPINLFSKIAASTPSVWCYTWWIAQYNLPYTSIGKSWF